jgi:MFS family permease
MLKHFRSWNGGLSKEALASTVLLSSVLVWYFFAAGFLSDAMTTQGLENSVATVLGLSIASLAIAAFVGVFAVRRLGSRVSFLRFWLAAGVAVSFSVLGINLGGLASPVIASIIVGAFFGFGMPVCLAFFAASTEPENRGRLGGLAFLAVFVGTVILQVVSNSDVLIAAGLLAALMGAGFGVSVKLKVKATEFAQSSVSYVSVLLSRGFLLYFIPWIMFSIVNYVARPITANLFASSTAEFNGDFIVYSTLVANVLSGVFAVIAGFYGDRAGRKRLVIAGFALVGLGYACLGLFPNAVLGWWFYSVVDGIAWGAFYTIFVMAIWGDLAQGRGSEKYYVLGSMPFLFSLFIQFNLANYASSLPTTAIFSFASIFLFLAVLPLAYAPETLEKCLKRRELKNYVERAQKARLAVG